MMGRQDLQDKEDKELQEDPFGYPVYPVHPVYLCKESPLTETTCIGLSRLPESLGQEGAS
jgi:hypothetical protein